MARYYLIRHGRPAAVSAVTAQNQLIASRPGHAAIAGLAAGGSGPGLVSLGAQSVTGAP